MEAVADGCNRLVSLYTSMVGEESLDQAVLEAQTAVVSTIPITGQASQPILENLYSYIYSQNPEIVSSERQMSLCQ